MATQCPCGCGRKVGWSKKGSAVGVRAMDDMLGLVTPVIEAELASGRYDDQTVAENEKFLANGRQLRQWFLSHVHKEARPGTTPDVLSLKRMLDAFTADVRSLMAPA